MDDAVYEEDVRALIFAVERNDLKAVEQWVALNGVNARFVYRFSGSSLKDELAGATAFNVAVCLQRPALALWLLDNGAEQNVPTYRTTGCYESETEIHPLTTAIELGLAEVAQAMVKQGVDLEYRQWRWNEDMNSGVYDPPLAQLLKERANDVIPFFRKAGLRVFLDRILVPVA